MSSFHNDFLNEIRITNGSLVTKQLLEDNLELENKIGETCKKYKK